MKLTSHKKKRWYPWLLLYFYFLVEFVSKMSASDAYSNKSLYDSFEGLFAVLCAVGITHYDTVSKNGTMGLDIFLPCPDKIKPMSFYDKRRRSLCLIIVEGGLVLPEDNYDLVLLTFFEHQGTNLNSYISGVVEIFYFTTAAEPKATLLLYWWVNWTEIHKKGCRCLTLWGQLDRKSFIHVHCVTEGKSQKLFAWSTNNVQECGCPQTAFTAMFYKQPENSKLVATYFDVLKRTLLQFNKTGSIVEWWLSYLMMNVVHPHWPTANVTNR